ncbi:MAG: SRPBCC domain-containing protein, partial [Candidatus Kariarchaeaceae archaeon]
HTEEYEHVGEVETLSINLKEWYSQNRENLNKPVRIGKEEAVIHIPFTFDHPRPIVWQWMTDNQLRNRNDPGYQFTQIERPGGESNIGSKTHCAHGRGVSLEIILDWQPFNYFTLDTLQNPDKPSKLDATITYEFEEIDDKTQMNAYLVPHSKFPRIIVALLRWVMTRQMLKTYRNLNRLMGITKDLPLLDLTAIIED